MHFENLFSPTNVGQAHHHLTVESARSQQRGVQYIRPVGRGNHNHAVIEFKTVHLHKELVKGLLTLIVTATQARTAMAAHRIDLIDKDDTGRLFFGLLEHVANPRRTYAHEHLDKVRARDREKRHLGLASDRLGEQGLTGSGLAHHEHTPRDTTAQLLETTGIAEEFNQLLHVLFCFLNPRDVGKSRGDLVFTQ